MSAGGFPPDAICAIEHCGHRFEVHRVGSNCDVCELCENGSGVWEPKAWHDFAPVRLAGGAVSPSQERAAYERALRGEL